MKERKKKLLGEERRQLLLRLLKESNKPITGNKLANIANVSRQVIVGDITILKARNEPIIATSQGYLYMNLSQSNKNIEETIVCLHNHTQAEQELYTIVDHGVTVKNVTIEHPIYGDLTASLMLSNRAEVKDFLKKVQVTNASLLSALTSGIHLHTLIAPNKKAINEVKKELREAGILLEEN